MKEIKIKNIEGVLRRLSVKQLEALLTFIPSGSRTGEFLNVNRASASVHTAEDENKKKAVGGIISTLSKLKIENENLILAAGKDEEGMRWILNEKVITREKLKEILLQIPGLSL